MSKMHEANPHYIHHQKTTVINEVIAEIVFGAEDGMVSTMGAVTGIVAGSHDHFIVLLSGLVIIAVESISMAVGSYLSTKSEKEIVLRKLEEERIELRDFPKEEEKELREMYQKDGWPENLASEMASVASKDEKLFLQEMAFRELSVIPHESEGAPWQNGVAMGISYILGGAVPLLPYLVIFNVNVAVFYSVAATLAGLFILGSFTTKFTKRIWWRAGIEMVLLASAAGLVGYGIGQLVENVLVR